MKSDTNIMHAAYSVISVVSNGFQWFSVTVVSSGSQWYSVVLSNYWWFQ